MLRTFRHKYQYFVTVQADGELRNISFNSYNPIKTQQDIKDAKADLIEYTNANNLAIINFNLLS